MDKHMLKGFQRWVDDDRTRSADLKRKREALCDELDIARDPDLQRACQWMIAYIDEELMARRDIERLRRRR
ncbi:MAG: hypothetical protein E6Q76_08225 [Rhizobium sp.]|nr:MAG: hypothetical protein E6Q76_08225 [Rhizobium sp.]